VRAPSPGSHEDHTRPNLRDRARCGCGEL
jgi:hypothetical protein